MRIHSHTRRFSAGAAVLAALLLSACGPKHVSISAAMTEFQYDPPTWQVPANSIISLTLTNNGTALHTWTLMESGYTVTPPFSQDDKQHVLQAFQVDVDQTQTFTFTAPSQPGTYEIVCSEPGHLEAGMKGTLTVQ
jgi:plastocyanin